MPVEVYRPTLGLDKLDKGHLACILLKYLRSYSRGASLTKVSNVKVVR
jgi:hypothetical protein